MIAMSVKPENNFITAIHRKLPLELHYEKMNNPYSSGTPDVWYSGNKADLWAEYKFLPQIPQTAIIDPLKLLSVLQHNWLRERNEEGRNVVLIIGCEQVGGAILRCQEFGAMDASTFRNLLVPRGKIAQWIAKQTMR